MPAREALRGLMQGHTAVAAPIARDLAAPAWPAAV